MLIPLHILAFTRSVTIDYRWIYGLKDKKLQKELEESISPYLQEISSAAHKNLSPIRLFFKVGQFFVLGMARMSPHRIDKVGRRIYDYAFLLWDIDTPLKYNNLIELSIIFERNVDKIFNNISENIDQLSQETYGFKINRQVLKYLLYEPTSISFWELPYKLTPEDLVKYKLSVEISGKYSFFDVLADLNNQHLDKTNPICVSKGLDVSGKLTSQSIWIKASSDKNTHETRVLDETGNIIFFPNIKKKTPDTTINNLLIDNSMITTDVYIDVKRYMPEPPTKSSTQKSASVTEEDERQSLNIFLCHTTADKPAVRVLYKQLSASGCNPWLDEENILPGHDWEYEILKAVREADIILVCLSNKSINKAGYVQKEMRYALDRACEQPEGSIFLIPLKLEECVVPEFMKRWQFVNFFEESGYKRLTQALCKRAENLGRKLPLNP